jgi:hypothetical protein
MSDLPVVDVSAEGTPDHAKSRPTSTLHRDPLGHFARKPLPHREPTMIRPGDSLIVRVPEPRPGQADPPRQTTTMVSGQLVHGRSNGDGTTSLVPITAAPEGAEPVPRMTITKARSSSGLATRDAQAYGAYGAAPEGPHELTRIHPGVPR